MMEDTDFATTDLRTFALALADAMDGWPREGATTDTPEGMRTVLLSDTLTRMIAGRLRELAADEPVVVEGVAFAPGAATWRQSPP